MTNGEQRNHKKMSKLRTGALFIASLTALLFAIVLLVSGCSGGSGQTPEPLPPNHFRGFVKNNVLVLDELTIENINEIEPGLHKYTLPTNSPPVQFREGQIIVNSKGEGAIHKINKVSTDNSSNILLETGQATLEDIFHSTEVFGFKDFVPSPEDIIDERISLKPGVTLDRSDPSNWIFHISGEYPIYEDDKVKVSVDGDFSFDPRIDFLVQYGWFGLSYLKFGVGGEETSNLEVKVESKIPGVYGTFEKEIEIGHIPLGPQFFDVGGVPILISPKISAKVGVKGGINGKMLASIKESLEFYGGVEYNNYQWTPVGIASPAFEPKISSFEEVQKASITAYVKGEVILSVFGIVGPRAGCSAGFNPEVDFSLVGTSEPWWKVSLVCWCNAGVDINILSWYRYNYLAEVFNLKLPAYDSEHPHGYKKLYPDEQNFKVPINTEPELEQAEVID
jgi:hypothetical protein